MAALARVGVIGCGWWSTFAHLPALVRNPSAEIVGIADPNPENLSAAGAAFEIDARFANAEEMLDSTAPDAVVVAVPPAYHQACAHQALSRGAHVLLEKPMVIEPADGRALMRTASERSVELVIGYPWHYNEHALALRQLIAEGAIGKIEHVSTLFASIARELYRGNPEPYRDVLSYTVNAPDARTYSDPAVSGGGQGHNQLTHSAALLFWVTGLEPASVTAATESFEMDVDLVDAATVRFRGGAIGALSSTGSVLPNHADILEYRIFGDGGHILFDVTEGTASVCTAAGARSLPPLELAARYPHWAPADNLVDIALGRAQNGSPAEVGLRTVEFLNALYASAAAGNTAVDVASV